METALHEGNLTDEFNAVFGDEPSEDDIIEHFGRRSCQWDYQI